MPRKHLCKVVATTVVEGSYDVQWLYNGAGLHVIKYGAQSKAYEGCSGDLHAGAEYGRCVRHAIECAGLFNS